jgi:CBS domain-containing protein
MRVAELLKRKDGEVIATTPETPILTAAKRMRLEGIGALVVRGAGAPGLVTERDIVNGFAAHGARLAELTVGDLMDRAPAACPPDAGVRELMGEVLRRRVRHILVMEHGQLLGIVSIGDLLKSRLDETEMERNVLRDAWIARH